MSNSHARHDQVNVVVTEDQKQRWQTHLDTEAGQFQSLSQLIRQAVEHEIATTTPEQEAKGAAEFGEVLETVTRIDEKLTDLETRLSRLESHLQPNPELRDLATDVFEALPTKPQLQEYQQLLATVGTTPPEDVAPRAHSGQVKDLATTLDEAEHRIADAITVLQENTHRVHTIDDAEATRYYKEV